MMPNDPRNPAPGEDPGLDDFTAVESAWHDLPAEEPPELVDLAVRNAARKAVEQPRPWFWNMNWVHGLTTAGVLALAVTLLLQVREEVPQPSGLAPPPAPATHLDLRVQDADAQRAGAATINTPAGDAPQPMRERLESAPRQDFSKAEDQQVNGSTQRAAAATNALSDALEEDAPAAAPPIERAMRASKQQAEPESFMIQSSAAPTSTENLSAASDDASLEEAIDETPEAWLNRIRELLQAGDNDAAMTELEAFRDAWPDHPIPSDWLGPDGSP